MFPWVWRDWGHVESCLLPTTVAFSFNQFFCLSFPLHYSISSRPHPGSNGRNTNNCLPWVWTLSMLFLDAPSVGICHLILSQCNGPVVWEEEGWLWTQEILPWWGVPSWFSGEASLTWELTAYRNLSFLFIALRSPTSKNWRDSSVAKSICCYCRGLRFDSQHPQAVHNHL